MVFSLCNVSRNLEDQTHLDKGSVFKRKNYISVSLKKKKTEKSIKIYNN